MTSTTLIIRSTSSIPATTRVTRFGQRGPLVSPNPISPVRRLGGPFRPLAPDAFCAIGGAPALNNGHQSSRALRCSGHALLCQGEDRVIGPLGTANHEIREAEQRGQQRRRARLAEPRRLTDELLGQLEELNLDGVRVVPGSYDPRPAEIRRQHERRPRHGERVLERLQSGTRTAELIETVFMIREIIAPPILRAGAVPFEEPDLA